MSRNLESEIYKFVGELPYWQQYLAAYALNHLDAEKVDVVEESFGYLLSENDLAIVKEKPNLGFETPRESEVVQHIDGLKLLAVKDFKNINAIRSGQCLPVAKSGITILGGLNGAGKSSIARLLNSVFYSRGDDEIIPNIFEPGDGNPASGTFVFEKADGSVYELHYVADGNHKFPEFRQFGSFDTKCVNIHLNDENELHIAPSGFHFFRELAELTTSVLEKLTTEINKTQTKNLFTDLLDGNSDIKTYVLSLDSTSLIEDIKKKLNPDETDDAKLEALNREINDLNLVGIESQHKELSTVKSQLATIKSRIDQNSKILSTENIKQIESTISNINSLNKSIENTGAELFKGSGIKGSGTDTWKTFIESSKDLALLQHQHYPTQEDFCLFCTQSLNPDSIKQIKNYWEFLKTDAESRLREAKGTLVEKNTEISVLNFSTPDETSALVAWLLKNSKESYDKIKSCLQSQKACIANLSENIKSLEWKSISTPEILSLDELAKTIDSEQSTLDTKPLSDKKGLLEKEIQHLKHKKKMNEKLTEIIAWVNHLKWWKTASALKESTSTRAITDAGKKLFDEHVTKKYQQIFHQECTDLNARFRLELVQKGRGGKSQRKYQIEGFPPGKILSEGEQRAVSLADFITELKISGIDSGWVFDDPVNSQDIERKDLIAKKLVTEAQDRQILVFSHDITFIFDLNGWADKLKVPIQCHWVERQGLDSGIIHENVPPDFESAYLNPDKAEKKLTDAQDGNLNPMERENRCKEGFACLRTSYEAFVIQKMLAKVVKRFDRRMGYNIEEIYAPPEWTSKVSRKLGTLSGYIEGHSHSDVNYRPLKPEMLEAEITEFKQMKKDFEAERKAARKDSGMNI